MTDITCASCGSAQPAGSALCAVCGAAFPRTGSPAAGPAGHEVRAPFGAGAREAAPEQAGVVAGTGRRFAAWVIDTVAVGIVAAAVLVIGLSTSGIPLDGGIVQVTPDEAAVIAAHLVRAYLLAALVGAAGWVALIAVEGRTGRTIGGAMLGLRTLDAQTPAPLGFWRALVRWLVIWAGGLVVVGQFVVLASPAFDGPRRQGWHDKLARALVLRVQPAPAPAFAAPAAQVPQAVVQGVPSPPGSPVVASPVGPAALAVPATPAPASAPAPVAADPWGFPADAAPEQGPGPVPGLISGVPGMSRPESPAPASPQAPGDAPAVPAASAQAAPQPEADDGQTRMVSVAPRPAALEIDPGGRVAVITAPTVVGRNPQAPADGSWQAVPVPDTTRSMSKTHAELYPDPGGLWVVDRGSTNGTVVSVPGQRPRIAEPGHRVRVPFGATLHLGDCPVRVVEADA